MLSYPVRVLSRGTNAIVDSFADMPSASEGRALAIQEVRDALMQDHGSIEEALAAAHNAMGTDKQLTAADLGPNSRGTLELVNMILRLSFGSAKRFFAIRKFPHLHHMFLGIIFLFFFKYWYLLEIGIAMIIQDLLHHFIILPLWVGEMDFP